MSCGNHGGMMLELNTKTPWGIICAIGYVGERYYWMIDEHGVVSMIDAHTAEASMERLAQCEKHE